MFSFMKSSRGSFVIGRLISHQCPGKASSVKHKNVSRQLIISVETTCQSTSNVLKTSLLAYQSDCFSAVIQFQNAARNK